MPAYDAITPTQWVLFLWVALIAFSIMWWLFWHAGRTKTLERDEAGPVEIVARVWYAVLNWRPFVMETFEDAPAGAVGTPAVHVPIPSPGTAAGTTSNVAGGTETAAPDTEALEASTEAWNTPRISTRLSDAEMIALLAAQRGKDGKHRYSANQIHTLVGGARGDVLAQVRALRDGTPAVFRPLTDEQQQLRAQLHLGER